MKRFVVISVIGIISAVIFIRGFSLYTKAQTCMTQAEIDANARCLLVWNGKIYEKGIRTRLHHGHACGSDVTSVMPSFHIANIAYYLDPAYVTTVCTGPTPTPTSGTIPGDADGNGIVDGRDYSIWANHYAQNVTGSPNGDFDTNGLVDGRDYAIWMMYTHLTSV